MLSPRPAQPPPALSVPSAYGTLTVRSLLDTREHCLNEFNFPDPYSKVSAALLQVVCGWGCALALSRLVGPNLAALQWQPWAPRSVNSFFH